MSLAETIQQKVSSLPPEKQEQVLHYVETLGQTKEEGAEPISALRSFARLKLDGPSDASTRFHEYLYGENARDNK